MIFFKRLKKASKFPSDCQDNLKEYIKSHFTYKPYASLLYQVSLPTSLNLYELNIPLLYPSPKEEYQDKSFFMICTGFYTAVRK